MANQYHITAKMYEDGRELNFPIDFMKLWYDKDRVRIDMNVGCDAISVYLTDEEIEKLAHNLLQMIGKEE